MTYPSAVQANSFGAAAATYERGRPPYPAEALDWLLPAVPGRVLDLGAGTGQLTRQLVDRGWAVVAVEPSAAMRDQLHEVLPDVRVLKGSAEHIPLADAAVDVVVVAQAWHWVDVDKAVPEVARVLAPSGRLGLIWNIRDERQDWVARLGRIMHQGTEQDMGSTNPQVGAPFGPIDRLDVEWTHRLSSHEVVDLVASRSYIITLPADERAAVLDRVRELLGSHPHLADQHKVALPYVSHCSRTQLA